MRGNADNEKEREFDESALNFTDYKYDYAMEDKIKKLEQIMSKKRS